MRKRLARFVAELPHLIAKLDDRLQRHVHAAVGKLDRLYVTNLPDPLLEVNQKNWRYRRCEHMPIEDYSAELFDRVVATNLRGVWLCLRAIIRYSPARLDEQPIAR